MLLVALVGDRITLASGEYTSFLLVTCGFTGIVLMVSVALAIRSAGPGLKVINLLFALLSIAVGVDVLVRLM